MDLAGEPSSTGQILWQTPIAHRGREAAPHRERSVYDAIRSDAGGFGMISCHGGGLVQGEDIWRFQTATIISPTSRMADMKRPFACYGDAEDLGIGPKEMEPNDRVFLLFSRRNFPFLLRLLRSGRYKLIGEACMSRLMHDEVI